MPKEDVKQLSTLASKASLHSMLAQAMNYPDAALVERLSSGQFIDGLIQSFLGSGCSASDGLTKLAEECKHTQTSDGSEYLIELEKDYTRMFFASKPRLAHLFESVYREGRLFQDSTFEIVALYNQAGLAAIEEFKLPPDHIALELEFLSFLFFKEIEAIKQNDISVEQCVKDVQNEVIEKHLRPFAVKLSEKVLEHARMPVYKVAACVLQSYYGN